MKWNQIAALVCIGIVGFLADSGCHRHLNAPGFGLVAADDSPVTVRGGSVEVSAKEVWTACSPNTYTVIPSNVKDTLTLYAVKPTLSSDSNNPSIQTVTAPLPVLSAGQSWKITVFMRTSTDQSDASTTLELSSGINLCGASPPRPGQLFLTVDNLKEDTIDAGDAPDGFSRLSLKAPTCKVNNQDSGRCNHIYDIVASQEFVSFSGTSSSNPSGPFLCPGGGCDIYLTKK